MTSLLRSSLAVKASLASRAHLSIERSHVAALRRPSNFAMASAAVVAAAVAVVGGGPDAQVVHELPQDNARGREAVEEDIAD